MLDESHERSKFVPNQDASDQELDLDQKRFLLELEKNYKSIWLKEKIQQQNASKRKGLKPTDKGKDDKLGDKP